MSAALVQGQGSHGLEVSRRSVDVTARRDAGALVEEVSLGTLLASNPRAAFLLLNEVRYRAIQRLFGVRRDQVNLMTLVATLALAEAVQKQTEHFRGWLPSPTRGDAVHGVGVMNALGGSIAGPGYQSVPFFGPLVAGAVVGAVGVRALRQSANGIKATARNMRRFVQWSLRSPGTPAPVGVTARAS